VFFSEIKLDRAVKEIVIYTDGSCRGNPGPGGYGTLLRYKGQEREFSGGFAETTNNRMELMAVIRGIEALKEPCRVCVFSDSKYVIQAMDKGWIHSWREKGWSRGKESLKNADLWKRLYHAVTGHEISWNWVKGHAGIRENERCDVLAVSAGRGANLPVDQGWLDQNA